MPGPVNPEWSTGAWAGGPGVPPLLASSVTGSRSSTWSCCRRPANATALGNRSPGALAIALAITSKTWGGRSERWIGGGGSFRMRIISGPMPVPVPVRNAGPPARSWYIEDASA